MSRSLIFTFLQIVMFLCIPASIIAYFAKFGLTHFYDVQLDGDALTFIAFRKLTVCRIPLASIERVYGEAAFVATHGFWVSYFGVTPAVINRFPRAPSPIIIQRKSGFPKYLAITPASPQEFLSRLNDKVQGKTASLP
jgi:hypothetical protein